MSTNLHVRGIREITVNKTGEQTIQICHFSLRQTPTKVTYKILESENHLQSYIDWINEDRVERQEPIYHDHDIFEEGEIIGYKTVCISDYHLQHLREFIAKSEADGYDIEFFAL